METQRQQYEQEIASLRTERELSESTKSLEALHAQTALAQLGGELVDKELQLYEARAALAPLQKELEEAKTRAEECEKKVSQKDGDITYLRNYLNTFQERSQEKVR